MRFLVLMFWCVLAFCLEAGDGAHLISFDRPVKAGDCFDCEARAEGSAVFKAGCKTDGGAPQSGAVSRKSSVSLAGEMRVTEVTPEGKPSGVEFTFSSLKASSDGKDIPCSFLKGKTLRIALAGPGAPVFKSVGGGEISKGLACALSLVFRPVSKAGLKEMADPGKAVRIGESWTVSPLPATELLAARGLKIPPENIDCRAALTGRETFRGVDCWKLSQSVRTKDGLPSALSYDAEILLPADPGHGGPVMIKRKGRETTSGSVSSGGALAAGVETSTEINDSMEAVILPAKN